MSEGWRSQALCRSFESLPWIEEPVRQSSSALKAMGCVCRSCPVRPECALFAIGASVTSGFWAGRDWSLRGNQTSASGDVA